MRYIWSSDHPARHAPTGDSVRPNYSAALNQIWAAEFDSGCDIDFLLTHSREAFRELFSGISLSKHRGMYDDCKDSPGLNLIKPSCLKTNRHLSASRRWRQSLDAINPLWQWMNTDWRAANHFSGCCPWGRFSFRASFDQSCQLLFKVSLLLVD